jgi:hypothetical protein
MNKVYLILIFVFLFILFNTNLTENFENIQYKIINSYGLYLKSSNTLQTVSPYLLSKDEISANTFYINTDNNLLDSGNNYVRYYSNNLVTNYGPLIYVENIENTDDYYFYYFDETNAKMYVCALESNSDNYENNYNLFTQNITKNDNSCIFTFIRISKNFNDM